jgi:hypothetical protein
VSPLTATAPLLLHTGVVLEALEHLVVALVVQLDHAVEARPFGRNSQAQDGVDVAAFFASGAAAVNQAKKYECAVRELMSVPSWVTASC